MKYESNINSVVLNLEAKLKKASDVSSLQREVATYLTASNTRRIHNEGKAVNGQSIGNYSFKPIYVNPKISPKKFQTKGKYGNTKFKNGQLHKTGYFFGWGGFRSSIGRNASFVNLQLTGRLRFDWAMEQRGKDWIIGFGSYGAKVSIGNEQRFGKQIWGVSKQDYEMIKKIETEFINKALA